MITLLLCNVLVVFTAHCFPLSFVSSFLKVLKQLRQHTGCPGHRAPLIEVAYFWHVLIFGCHHFQQLKALEASHGYITLSHTHQYGLKIRSLLAQGSLQVGAWKSGQVGSHKRCQVGTRKSPDWCSEVGRLQAHARKLSGASEVARLAQGYYRKLGGGCSPTGVSGLRE